MDQKLAFLGWSQAELARRLGVKPATVTSWRRRGLPCSVELWLDDVVWQVERARAVLARYERARGRPRGRAVKRDETWQRSAADSVMAQAPDGDYRSKLDRWEGADMDQDSDEWGRG